MYGENSAGISPIIPFVPPIINRAKMDHTVREERANFIFSVVMRLI